MGEYEFEYGDRSMYDTCMVIDEVVDSNDEHTDMDE